MPAAQDSVQTFARLLRIAHHIPGRVRLKLAAEAGADLGAAVTEVKAFIGAVTSIPGIRAVSLNPLARSCVVEYDPARIPPAAWADLIGGTPSAAAQALAEAIAGCGR